MCAEGSLAQGQGDLFLADAVQAFEGATVRSAWGKPTIGKPEPRILHAHGVASDAQTPARQVRSGSNLSPLACEVIGSAE